MYEKKTKLNKGKKTISQKKRTRKHTSIVTLRIFMNLGEIDIVTLKSKKRNNLSFYFCAILFNSAFSLHQISEF